MLLGITLNLLMTGSARAITVQDSLGQHLFTKPAERVVTLNWGATEEVLELGITPVGIADIQGYNTWVASPAITGEVVDVGTRAEPNIELLLALKPDLIIVGTMQQDMVERLQPIAPVLYFDNYRADHNNIDAIQHSFRELAKALGKSETAEQRLLAQNTRLESLKQQIQQRFSHKLPKVTVVRISDGSHVRAYGENSMPEAALKALGIDLSVKIPRTTWGQVHKPTKDLAYMEGVMLYIRPLPDEDALFRQPLFRMMPFVQEGRIAPVEPTWTYGGALSVGYLAEHIVAALSSLPDEVIAKLQQGAKP